MKEIMAIIRQEKINKTKDELLNINISGMTVRKVLGRGRKLAEFDLSTADSGKAFGLSQGVRLMPKRLITMIVPDEEVEKVVHAIIKVNKTSNIGDGKIFVLPIIDAYRVRDAKKGNEVI
ncbi:P-II family nitrogen regulator [Candidatus Poribacteria bacterium]|nr:P-II family nitrogen regulator [Candidatus Poribacteria bacterium]